MSYIGIGNVATNPLFTSSTLTAGASTLASLRVLNLVPGGNIIANAAGDLIIGPGGSGGSSLIPGANNTVLVSDGFSTVWLQISDGYVSPTAAIQGSKIQSATTTNLGVVQLAGDIGGTATSVGVLKIHGATVPIAGGLTTGNVLQVNGASSLTYAPVNLAGGPNFVTGTLPIGSIAAGAVNQVFITTSGGATGWALLANANISTSAAIAVLKLAPGSNTDVLTTVAGVATWTTIAGGGTPVGSNRTINTTLPLTGGGNLSANLTLGVNNATTIAVGVIQLTGDLGGTATSPTVVGITGTAGTAAIHATNLNWDVGVSTPTITQTTSGGATGGNLTIRAQNAATTGGNLVLSSGSGASTQGLVRIQVGSSDAFVANTTTKFTLFASQPTWQTGTLDPTTAGLVEIDGSLYTRTGSPNGDLYIRHNGTWVSVNSLGGGSSPTGAAGGDLAGTYPDPTVIAATGTGGLFTLRSTVSSIRWVAASTNGQINFADTSSAPGAALTIQAQNTTAASQPGGPLLLSSGNGTGVGGFAGSVQLQTGNTPQLVITNTVSSTVIEFTPATVRWIQGTILPKLTQVDKSSGSATAMVIAAQNAIGTGTPTAGTLNLQGGTSTNGTGGAISIAAGAGPLAAGTVTITTGSFNHFVFNSNVTGGIVTMNDVNLQWLSTVSNPKITQASRTVGVGEPMDIIAQSTSASGQTGGALRLTAGSGTVSGAGGAITLISGSGTLAEGVIQFIRGSRTVLTLKNIGAIGTADFLAFDSTIALPTIGQDLVSSGLGRTLTVQAQQSTSGTGGLLSLNGGAAPSGTGGNVTINSGAGANASSAGIINFNLGGVGQLQLNTPGGTPVLEWNSALTTVQFRHASKASGTGANFGITAQTLTGGAGAAGNLSLVGGSNTGGVGGSVLLSTGQGSTNTNHGQVVFTLGGGSGAHFGFFSGVNSGGLNFQFQPPALSVVSLGVEQATGNNPGSIFQINGQTAGPSGGPGGSLLLISGSGTGGNIPGSLVLNIGGGSTLLTLFQPAAGRNVLTLCGTSANATEMPASSGNNVMYVRNAATNPTSGVPVGGGILWAQGGALMYKGTSGTQTTVGSADPHCPRCGRDFVHEWYNSINEEKLSVCVPCMMDALNKIGISSDNYTIENTLKS